ncbi:helix-turn-helix domain-containing protein [Litorivicinus sp.]|nr:helix-turn-helix domain-containing protein [Litorivicinus sp.]
MEKVVFSPSDIDQVESLAAGLSVEQVAHYFGIGKTTFYEVAKRQPELLERYKQGKAKRIAQYVSIVHDKILDGNIDLLKLYLRTQAGWTENRFEGEVRELPPIQITVVRDSNHKAKAQGQIN